MARGDREPYAGPRHERQTEAMPGGTRGEGMPTNSAVSRDRFPAGTPGQAPHKAGTGRIKDEGRGHGQKRKGKAG